MPTHCLALLLSLANACTLPGSPLSLRVALQPHPDLCVQYRQHAPLCASRLLAALQSQPLFQALPTR
ncbi:hypothetical protein [Stenotrophomonas rhizophila]|uniref:hypothetical protein n=1 Tax=Stenotrophomonas rhizophila TaxID=216778 RepID=UPI001E57FA81|nr:hypothetical protein [Stenotrophomonas rhizophila]MCC7632760.1 hypothetical protein [Stenotrophomonas rhizophila]MCC7662515.1 hypothetical protein [Stenotrophomonas rhizophila]